MSWMQYLAVNRSFCSIDNRPTRFRMRDEYLLPRFSHPQETEDSQDSIGASVSESGQTDEANRAQVKGSAMQNNNIVETVSKTVSSAPNAHPGGRWRIWRNPFGQTAAAKAAPTPVQTELRLESVKVVRNDLTDSDLLLISPQAAAGAPHRADSRTRRTDGNERKSLLGRVQQLLAGF
jgi:hypothetical protein